MSAARPQLMRCLAALALAVLVVLLAAGCGGSGPADATGEEGAAAPGPIVESRDAVSTTEGEIAAGQYPNGHDTDEESVTGYKPVKPCTLVSAAQANRILGGHVKVSEHLQGPTCAFGGSGREVMLVVMEAPLKPLVAGARSAQPLTVAGHPAWCLHYETTSIVTAVSGGRVLQVTGACPAAARFAAAALAWL
jgi:hypothetical protein